MNMNQISNYSVDENYRNMLSTFRSYNLKTLLRMFGLSTAGRKSELIDRAFEVIRTKPANINYSAYIAQIREIYVRLKYGMRSNDIMMRCSLFQNQQEEQPQRMYQSPQYLQQSMHTARAGLPQVMPQTQVNNYIQFIDAGPSRTRTIVSNQLPPNQQTSIVEQDALGLGTTASGNNSYTPPIETVSQIKYKKLPFYEVIDEVIKPTLLTGTRLTLPNAPEGMKEVIFTFTLSLEQANSITSNRDISPGKNEYRNQFQIRICQFIEPGPNESPDYMPLDLVVQVNKKRCQLPPLIPTTGRETKSRLMARPIDCTEHIKLSPIVRNTITINWTPDEKSYVFGMYLVKKITTDNLIEKLLKKVRRSSEETKNLIIKNLANVDPDLATISYRFSLICPLSKTRMKIPAKSIHCDHLQCFDASTFILMNEKKPTWMCPTCDKPCLYDDIQIENYFFDVVSSSILKQCNKEIEISIDGSWKFYEETIETKNINSTSDIVKPNDSVDLVSDDEECTEPKTGPSPENFKSSFIDLTISDDEGPQAQVQLQQAVTRSDQGVVIEIYSPSPHSSPTPKTEAS